VLDLRLYRLGLAPILAALVVAAFSLDGVPEPLEPAPGTGEFDAEQAMLLTRSIVRMGETRAPGSAAAAETADFVRARFEEVAAGDVAEQRFEGSVDGDDVELRNVLLTLPGSSEQTIVIVAERDARSGPGATTTAAATGVLLELGAELGVSGRERTVILASIDGAGSEAEATDELLDALPSRLAVDVALVLSQPGPERLSEPHLVTSSGSDTRPSMELIRSAQEALSSRAGVEPGLDGALGQIGRFAVPAASGVQAALLAEGLDAITISGAGEVTLPPEEAGPEQLSGESLERFGGTVLALVGAINATPAGIAQEPDSYVSVGDNIVPGWALSLLALALIIPPGLAVAQALGRAAGRDHSAGPAIAWAGEWALAAVIPLLVLFGLGLAGLVPDTEIPYDPGRFSLGPTEAIALLLLVGVGVLAWWVLGVRRAPARPDRATLGAAAGAVVVLACTLAWLANPLLALVLSPLAHVVVVHALPPGRRAAAAVPAAAIALLPLVAALVHTAAALDWGGSAPWQLVVLIAGGGLGWWSVGATVVALAGVAAVVRAAFGGRNRGTASEPA
jgi:hypothetical protein